jgi:predicted nucleic acid-binding protein
VALTHVVDTSVMTRLHLPEVRRRVADLAVDNKLGRTFMTDLEIGFSARNGREWEQLNLERELLPCVEIADVHFRRALEVQRRLAQAGSRGRKIPDLLIAAAAESVGATVLHYDTDFDLIAGVTGQQVEWVVEPGSVD